MTDHTFAHLEGVVERTLKSVWASTKCKQALRMELLAHVVDIYDDEFATLDDEQAALNQTLCRFGHAEAIGRELQSSLSVVIRWFPFLLKDNRMKAWLWGAAVIAILTGPAMILPAIAKFKDAGVLPLLPLLAGIGVTVVGLVLVGFGLGRRFAHSS